MCSNVEYLVSELWLATYLLASNEGAGEHAVDHDGITKEAIRADGGVRDNKVCNGANRSVCYRSEGERDVGEQ